MFNAKELIKNKNKISDIEKVLVKNFNLDIVDVAIILAVYENKDQKIPRKYLAYRFSNMPITKFNSKISSLVKMKLIKKERPSYDERKITISIVNKEYCYNTLIEVEKTISQFND